MTTPLFTPLFAIMLCAFALTPGLAAGATAAEAAAYHDSGDYKQAYKQYLKLAKDGDPFAQYRVSYMNLVGQGTKADVSDSMAWAVVASGRGAEDLVRYRDAVAGLVPVKKRKSVQRKADTYLRRWGPEVESAADANPAGGCTGSRLARNCYTQAARPPVHIPWGEDRSEDPAQRELIEELNRTILENAADLGSPAGGR